MEANNLSDAEFKTLVVMMLKGLSEDLNLTKRIQSEMKYSLIKIKNNIQGNDSTVDEAENQINGWKHKEVKTNHQNNKKKKESKKSKDSISSLWDNFKRSNMHIIGMPEGKEKEQEIGILSENTVKENFPNLVKEKDLQVQEAQRVPKKMNAQRPTPRHIIIKMPKVKIKRES